MSLKWAALEMDDVDTVWVPAAGQVVDAAVMESCRRQLEVIWNTVPQGSSIFYIDYPMHLNFGDLLINKGVEKFFSESRYKVRGRISFFDVCDWPDIESPHIILKEQLVSRLLDLPKDTIFVFHGGGNLGDIYVEINSMRQALVARLHDYRVVVLPQSIHFSSAVTQHQCLSALLEHPDIHIFVRDDVSLKAIRAVSATAGIACPDMAHMLWTGLERSRNARPSRERLYMRRRDVESAGATKPSSADALDWIDLVTGPDTVVFRGIRKFHSAAPFGFNMSHSHRDWYLFRDYLLARAIRHFAMYREIDTDRLHGLILACLLGRKAIFAENSYGKVGRYHNRWFRQAPREAVQATLVAP